MKQSGEQRQRHETQNKTRLSLTTQVSEQSTCVGAEHLFSTDTPLRLHSEKPQTAGY